MSYTLTRSFPKKTALLPQFELNSKMFLTLSFISISILLVLNIFQVNYLAQEISLVRTYEKKLNQLSENNEQLEIDWAKSSSLVNIEQYLQYHNFKRVNPNQVKYIRILESSVAKKR
jgi:hypothetical protein